MKPIHHVEKEQFKKLFSQDKIEHFEERFDILKVFLQTERHLTASELQQMLSEQGFSFDLDFVRETLKLMCGFGFARKNSFDNGKVRYEHLHLGQHHDHMICTKCRQIIEFKNDALEALQAETARSFGFHMLQHRMEIYGICSKCLKQQVPLMPLSAARQGERVIIKKIRGGAKARLRLLSMGLRTGDQLNILTNNGHGQLAVAAEFTRYVLGRGMAQKVLVEPCLDPGKNQRSA